MNAITYSLKIRCKIFSLSKTGWGYCNPSGKGGGFVWGGVFFYFKLLKKNFGKKIWQLLPILQIWQYLQKPLQKKYYNL